VNILEKAEAMLRDAKSYFASAQILSERLDEDHGRASAMLSLRAFEIALKAAFVLDQKKDALKTHDYGSIWKELMGSTQEAILVMAGTEVGPIEGTKLPRYETTRLERRLERWEEAFIDGRYRYSKNLNRSQKQIREVRESWVSHGSPICGADFEFGGEDLYGLYTAIIKWCDDKIAGIRTGSRRPWPPAR
jgi:hypothetical protein